MPFASSSVRDTRRRQMAAEVRNGAVCWLCREPIDLALTNRHPKSLSADHVIPTAKGGTDDVENIRPAHLQCNVKRQNKPFADDIGFNSGSLNL